MNTCGKQIANGSSKGKRDNRKGIGFEKRRRPSKRSSDRRSRPGN
jgi:hypothetical protein